MAGLAASAATGLAAYGGIIEPVLRLETTTWAPRPAQWPADLPLRIVALADIHMSPPFMTLDRLRGIVAATNALNPDIVVLLGDYAEAHGFNTRTVSPDATAAVLAGLRSPLGTWSVMGNHDWAADPRAQSLRLTRTIWHDAFETAGVEVLSNRAAPLVHRGQPFWIAGLESQLAHSGGLDDLPGTLAQVTDEAPVLLLAHEPDIFVDVPDRVALTMCGHTHGGQVRILGRAPVVPSRYGERFAYGHIVEENRHLVVSGGLGCSRAPVRLGMPPELVVIEMGNIAE
jgi:predicted MPP superfamily phosphohydrolase